MDRGALSAQKELSPVNVGGLHPELVMGSDMPSGVADGGTGARGGLLGVPGASAPRPESSSSGRRAEEGAGRVWARGGGHSLCGGSGSAGGQGALSTPGAVPGAGLALGLGSLLLGEVRPVTSLPFAPHVSVHPAGRGIFLGLWPPPRRGSICIVSP